MIAAVNASGARNAIPGLPGGETPSFREMVRRISLGKTLIFTDNADWSDMEIVRGAQHHVESAFREEHPPPCGRHWTDQKVHVFCCVLALPLYSLPERTAAA